jgi:hypothetical protein
MYQVLIALRVIKKLNKKLITISFIRYLWDVNVVCNTTQFAEKQIKFSIIYKFVLS